MYTLIKFALQSSNGRAWGPGMGCIVVMMVAIGNSFLSLDLEVHPGQQTYAFMDVSRTVVRGPDGMNALYRSEPADQPSRHTRWCYGAMRSCMRASHVSHTCSRS